MTDKITPSLAVKLDAVPQEPLPVIVRYRPGVALAQALTAGAAPERRLGLLNATALRATPAQIQALSAADMVERIWEDLPVRAFLDTSVPYIGAPFVWESGFTGQGVKVAILDTGLDPTHPDFQGRIVNGADFSGTGARDRNGHGTHVAGIAAGAGATYRGVAPGASIYVVKVLGDDGGGMTSQVIAGLEWALEQGVQVANLSLGSSQASDGTDALSAACDEMARRGVVICAAAGNDGPGSRTIGSPGTARGVITVGASTESGSIVSFSSRGPTLDGRVKPDIVLPGDKIVSCRAANTSLGTPVDALYTALSGTSMATPHATGAVALLLQAFPGLTPAQVRERFILGARDLGLEPNTQGAGRLDVEAAYKGEQAPPEPPQPTKPGCLPALLALLSMRPAP